MSFSFRPFARLALACALISFCGLLSAEPAAPIADAFTVASDPGVSHRHATAAMAASGQNVIVYTYPLGSSSALVAKYQYPPSWVPYPESTNLTVSYGLGDRTEPAVAMSKYGYWMAVWLTTQGSVTTLHGRQFRGVEPVGPEFAITQMEGWGLFAPRVSTDSFGSRYTVAWAQR